MASKIIQKEKERQESLLTSAYDMGNVIRFHKQSLINLKEYLEEALKQLEENFRLKPGAYFETLEDQLEEDIKELNEMVGKYSEEDGT